MTEFTALLEVSPLDDGKHWRVLRPFGFECDDVGSGIFVRIKAGFITDFASFPKVIWRGLMWWLPAWAKFSKPSPIHDQLYQTHYVEIETGDVPGSTLHKLPQLVDGTTSQPEPVTRKRADDIFLQAMHVAWRKHRSGKAIARMEYIGVRVFGWLAWRGPAAPA